MTKEEAILWLNEEIRTWENECQSKHPIKEALYEACKALERELNTWSLDDAREDFMYDVYNILDFLPTNEEANRIIDIFDRVTSSIEQEPRWIPMVRREPTDEEKAEYLAQNGEELCYMLENEMPLNGQEVLVSIGKFVSEDVFDEDFYNFENNDIENVDAWMPLPQSYTGGEE